MTLRRNRTRSRAPIALGCALVCGSALLLSCGGGESDPAQGGAGVGGASRGGSGGLGGAGEPPCHNYALVFDGIDDVVTIEDHDELDGLTAFTIELRVRPTEDTGVREMELVSHEQYTSDGYALMFQDFTPLLCRVFTNGDLQQVGGSSDPNDTKHFSGGLWTNIAVTLDDGMLTTFVDGDVVGSAGPTITPPSDMDGVLRIGGSAAGPSFFLAGAIDAVRLSKVARYTDSGPAPPHEWEADEDTIGLWRFDEGSGLTALDETGEHHGALEGLTGPSNGPQYERIDCQGIVP